MYAHVSEHLETIADLDPDMVVLKQLDIPLLPTERNPDKQDLIRMIDYLRTGDHPYDFVYIDSLMRYAQDLCSWIKYEHPKKPSGYDLWMMFGEKMRKVLRLLVGLTEADLPKPVHVICTWGVEVAQDWEGKKAIVPVVDGKMVGPHIDYAFDDVLMLRKQQDAATGNVMYIAFTGGTHEFDAKVSSGAQTLPTTIANPNLYRILLALQGKPLPPK